MAIGRFEADINRSTKPQEEVPCFPSVDYYYSGAGSGTSPQLDEYVEETRLVGKNLPKDSQRLQRLSSKDGPRKL